MSTGTEVAVDEADVGAWAITCPENHIAYMRREQLVVGDGAKFTPAGGKERAMRSSDIDNLLERADRERDGSYRVVASKALPGKPIGRIRFRGTRPDDPNDLVAHEDRRELRGYGVFAAWLNHVDAKAINSLDMLVTENGRSFVRHNLIDFGSSLGSGGVAPADYWAGTQYLLQPRDVGKPDARVRVLPSDSGTLRSSTRRDRSAACRSTTRTSTPTSGDRACRIRRSCRRAPTTSSGRPRSWWRSTTDMLRAAVRAGDFGDPASEEFLVRALAERRDAIGRAYLTAINPIADPLLDRDGILTFRNAAVDADFAAGAGRLPRDVVDVRQRHRIHHDPWRDDGPQHADRSAPQSSGRPWCLREGGAERHQRSAPVMGGAGPRVLPAPRWRLATGGIREAARGPW